MFRIRRYAVIGLALLGTTVAVLAGQGSAPSAFGAGYLGSVAPGQVVTVSGHGCAPAGVVTITWDDSPPTSLGQTTADAGGAWTADVTIPLGTSGSHNIVATCLDPGGQTLTDKTLVQVEATTVLATQVTSGSGPLAFTGLDAQLLVALAVVVLLIGGAAVQGARRNRKSKEAP